MKCIYSYAGKYVISGELTSGSVIVEADSSDKSWILLNSVSLHCDDSAAIVSEQVRKVFLTLADGTENSISSGGFVGMLGGEARPAFGGGSKNGGVPQMPKVKIKLQ